MYYAYNIYELMHIFFVFALVNLKYTNDRFGLQTYVVSKIWFYIKALYLCVI